VTESEGPLVSGPSIQSLPCLALSGSPVDDRLSHGPTLLLALGSRLWSRATRASPEAALAAWLVWETGPRDSNPVAQRNGPASIVFRLSLGCPLGDFQETCQCKKCPILLV
jgi:hypothetical protein